MKLIPVDGGADDADAICRSGCPSMRTAKADNRDFRVRPFVIDALQPAE